MITTVTLNPAIDKSIVLECFEPGAVNRTESVREDLGGKGINVARVLQALGLDTRALGFIGEDNLERVRMLLGVETLKTDFIKVPGNTRINLKIFETSTRVTTSLNEAGFPVNTEQIDRMKGHLRNYAEKSEALVFSGSIPKDADSKLYLELMQSVSDLNNLKIVLDTEGMALLEGLKAKPFMIKPNLHELEAALNQKLDSHSKIVDAAKKLISEYQIGFVLVSMGADGSILVAADQAFYSKAMDVVVKGTSGAGDSMLAGYLYGISMGVEPKEALAWATVCGALAVSRVRSQPFDKADAEALLSDVKIIEL